MVVKESKTGVIEITEFDVDTVKRMITSLYSGDYSVEIPEELVSSKNSEECSLRGKDRPWDKCVIHSRVATIADYYDISSTMAIANKKLNDYWIERWEINDFIGFLQDTVIANVAHALVDGLTSVALQHLEEVNDTAAFHQLNMPAEFKWRFYADLCTQLQDDLASANKRIDAYEQNIQKALEWQSKGCNNRHYNPHQDSQKILSSEVTSDGIRLIGYCASCTETIKTTIRFF